jgi:membrane protein implicated in regulation of membrane protease activity
LHPLNILFWSCFMLGGGYMVLTLLMGGLSHAVGHIGHVGHSLHLPHSSGGHQISGHVGDAGHAGPGPSHGSGQGHHADGHHHGGNQHGEQMGEGGGFNILEYLNPTFISSFLFGFGGLGALGQFLGLPPSTSLICASAGGLGLYAFAYLFVAKVFATSQATSHNVREELVGTRARVTAPIAGLQPGMVSYEVGGSRQLLRAITDDEEPIPTGATVRIRKIDNHTAHVMRIDQ